MPNTHFFFYWTKLLLSVILNKNEAGRSGKMIQIYKNYEGHKELEELDHIELESWVMITDPTMEELMNISRDYKIDMDDLKAALDTEERSRLENEDDYTMILVNIPVVEEEEENGMRRYRLGFLLLIRSSLLFVWSRRIS